MNRCAIALLALAFLSVEPYRPCRGQSTAIGDANAIVANEQIRDSAKGSSAKRSNAPRGEIRLPVTRDVWFSEVGAEADGNNGAAPRLKLKSHQEMSLVDCDVSSLRGKLIERASLSLHSVREPSARRVTIGSFGADWYEGTSTGYAPQVGSSSFNHKRHPQIPWTVPGSDLCSVILGQGGTTWRMADATPPDASGRQTIAIDPRIVAARIAGISEGFLVFDDTGSEWSREGDRFIPRPFPNRFFDSRDSNRTNAPYFTIVVAGEDHNAPDAPGVLQSETGDLPAGEAWVSWTTPRDRGPAGVIGFFIKADGKDLPRYLIPLAGEPGERVRMRLRDLEPKKAGEKPRSIVSLEIRAVDAAGNVGPASKGSIRISSRTAKPLPPATIDPFEPSTGPLPRIGAVEVSVVDELDKIDPVSGASIPAQEPGYFISNHIWSAKDKRIRLQAARNEFAAFQVVLKGNASEVKPTIAFEGGGDSIESSIGRYRNVATARGPLPDPIVDLADNESPPGVKSSSLYVELYIPHNAKAGERKGKLVLSLGRERLEIAVSLLVWDFTLPDRLSFIPEMNCYDLPADERDYYRSAHRHRTVINRVPYYHSGKVADGFAPGWNGSTLDWRDWDKRFGPYLDGSAFADLPRKNVPLECFYLPIHENWPTPIDPNYNGDYWADRAFTDSYRRDLVSVSRQFTDHLNKKGWHDTLFQYFFNGKNDFKRNGWSHGKCPWLLDEPAHTQDFWALRYFGKAFHEGADPVRGRAKVVFRADISRPQWQRDTLDGLLDYLVVAGSMRKYPRIVFDRKEAQRQIVLEYGSSNAIEASNTQPAGWSIDSWGLGADGVVPWQTIGTAESWTKADTLSLFYPRRNRRDAGPSPSIRLKAFRRGEQDVEYLTLYSQITGEPRWALSRSIRETLKLAPKREGTGFTAGEDAGVISYQKLTPQDLWNLRTRLGAAISAIHPPAKNKLVDFETPVRDLKRLNPGVF